MWKLLCYLHVHQKLWKILKGEIMFVEDWDDLRWKPAYAHGTYSYCTSSIYILGNLEMNWILTDLIESKQNVIHFEVYEAKRLLSD